MPASLRDKAANRAGQYRQQIDQAQADGDYRAGFDTAVRWLRAEMAKVRRQRPHHAPLVDRELTAQLVALAEAVPHYRPAKSAGQQHHGGKGGH